MSHATRANFGAQQISQEAISGIVLGYLVSGIALLGAVFLWV